MSPETAEFLSGIILMTVLGLSVGNFATSLVYRIPRNLKILNIPPYCECERKVFLEVRDNFPLLSWLMSRGKCRFCGISIPGLYAGVEIACAVLFVTALWRFGISEALVLMLLLGVFLIVLAAQYYAEGKLFAQIVTMTGAFGAMYRILLDDTIFSFVQGGFFGLIAGMLPWLILTAQAKKRVAYPPLGVLFALGGVCVGVTQLPLYLALAVTAGSALYLAGVFHPTLRRASWALGASFAIFAVLYYHG